MELVQADGGVGTEIGCMEKSSKRILEGVEGSSRPGGEDLEAEVIDDSEVKVEFGNGRFVLCRRRLFRGICSVAAGEWSVASFISVLQFQRRHLWGLRSIIGFL